MDLREHLIMNHDFLAPVFAQYPLEVVSAEGVWLKNKIGERILDMYGVMPDMITTAKALGNGFPCAALLTNAKVSATLKLDLLGTTFGGGPMACAVMEAVIEAIESESLLERVQRVAAYIRETCIVGPVTGHQGAGFLTGLRTTRPAKEIQKELLECGILVGTASDPNVLRLLPAFILEEEHVDMLRDTLSDLPA